MALTGKKRSLTVTINKTTAGVQMSGYPKTYYGQQAFIYNSVSYAAIDSSAMALLSVAVYQARLAAFEAYVESQESGLSIETVQTNEPYYTA